MEILKNFKAGIVVFLVALPLCLGIALASDAPIFSGLIAGIIGGTIVAAISGSALGVSGPAAGLAVIVATGIKDLADTYANGNLNDGFTLFLAAVVIAGALQVVLGFAKAGVIGYYFPNSVIRGMLAGIGVTLILKQIPHALGYDKNPEGEWDFFQHDSHNTISEIFYAFSNPTYGAVIIFLISVAILLLWNSAKLKQYRFFQIVPGALVVVVLGVLINAWFKESLPEFFLDHEKGSYLKEVDDEMIKKIGYNDHLVRIQEFDTEQPYFGLLRFPVLEAFTYSKIWVIGFTMAIVASLETLLSVEAVDKLDPKKRATPTNRELFAQGIGNMISGFIGGLPLTQVIVRSSANVNSGGTNKSSAIIHGVLLAGCVLAIPKILNMIPLATLAAILIIVGYKLASVGLFKKIYAQGLSQFIPFIVTILAILFTNLLTGIMIGLGVSVYFILMNIYKNAYDIKIDKSEDAHQMKITLSETVGFFNKGRLLKTLSEVKEGCDVHIDNSNTKFMDYDIIEMIEDFKDKAPEKGYTIHFTNEMN